MKKIMTGLMAVMLCVALMVSGGAAETREGVIALEGMEEKIEERLFDSSLGFSFWYATDALEAYPGEIGNIEGVVVKALYSDDAMVLDLIEEEDAEEYAEDSGMDIAEASAEARVAMDVYRDLEDGQYYFLTVIAEAGRYLRAVGQYSQEAAEGNAKYFQRVLDSVSFTPGCLIRAEWGTEEPDEEDRVEIVLTAVKPVMAVTVLWLEWDESGISREETAILGDLEAGQAVRVPMTFIGDMPNNGLQYTDEAGEIRAFALDLSGENGELLLWEIEE